jgi:hypothetical protein
MKQRQEGCENQFFIEIILRLIKEVTVLHPYLIIGTKIESWHTNPNLRNAYEI